MGEKGVDLSKIPLSALKKPTLCILSKGLNQLKIIPSDDGLPRDWRGLAHLIGLDGEETRYISTTPDPFLLLLNYWGKNGNLHLLQNYLGVIDRYDVLDDCKQLFDSNSLEYIESIKKVNTQITNTTNINLDSDKVILTTADVIRLENGGGPQMYDAFVLHAEEDSDFAAEIVETMESKYHLKLCIRDRDLIGGVQFEHDAIAKLIAERCRRLVVIVSSNFLKSKANKFFVTFAQALALDIRERKVIPILYEKCNVPPELSYYFFLDYNRASKLWNFWEKLRDSIQGPEMTDNSTKIFKSLPASTPTEYWISRTHFDEEKKQEPGSSTVLEPKLESRKISNKKKNPYKIIKNSFGRAIKNSNSELEKSNQKKSQSLLDNFASFTSNDNLLFENLENPRAFKASGENNKNEKVKKKKWFKKKNLETLLS